MSSNFEWQKRQANERVQLRLHEAAQHRRARQGQSRAALPLAVKMMIPVLAGIVLAIWLLTGCAASDASTMEVEMVDQSSVELTVADRIRFQDKLEANLVTEETVSPVTRLTMADRILFQDRRELSLVEKTGALSQPVWTMVERLRFHDRILSD